jgi:serine/threonine-protein kinase
MMKCPTCGARYSASERLCPKDGAVLEPEQSREKQFIGTTLDGKYLLESFISRGGMGAVYRGTHVMLNRPVAVKMIKADLVTSPEVVRRFQREARAATQLNHPNIVHVYDLGQTSEGTLYIAMELVSGESLKDAIKAQGPLEAARIVRVMSQVCDGLAVAHRAGVVHRDLKPHNIMLTRDREGAELAKIVDFGIAKTFEIDAKTQLTVEGATLGTPQYMSPEQAAGSNVDGRSDIYSLGVILYEMLTGEVPFQGESVPAVLVKHMSEAPTAPSLRRPDLSIPSALEAIALRCLAKYPADRYATAEDMRAALRDASSDIPPDAPTKRLAASAPADMTMPSGTTPPPLPMATPPQSTPGTRPTGPAVMPPPVPAAAPAAAASSTHSSRGPIAVVLTALLVLMLAVVGLGYWAWSRLQQPSVETTTTDAPLAPPTSPAGNVTTASADPQPPPAPPASAASATPDKPDATSSAASSGSTDPSAPRTSKAPGVRSAPEVAPVPVAPGARSARNTPRATEAAPGASGTAAGAAAAAPAAPRIAPVGPGSAPGAATQLPENPRVSFQCRGPVEICTPLRNEMAEALGRESLPIVRAGGDVLLTAEVEIVDERIDRSFGTNVAVRTYSIEMMGEAPRLEEDIAMPSRTVSADQRLGGERFVEAARLLAAEAVQRLRAFWLRKRQ